MNLGERIRQYANNRHGNVSKMANDMKLAYTQVSRYVNNQSDPSAKMLSKFALEGCDINWLLLGDEMTEISFPEQRNSRYYDILPVETMKVAEPLSKAGDSEIKYLKMKLSG